MFNKNGTALGETIRWQSENAYFIAVNLFWMINRNVFFASPETADSVLVNGCVNVLFSAILIIAAIRRSAGTVQSHFRAGYGLFIVYNVVPILLQQKSMFGIFLVIEIIYTVYSIVHTAKLGKTGRLYLGKKTTLGFAAIIFFFAAVFIARGVFLIAEIFPDGPLTNGISVAVADILMCLAWLASSVGLAFRKPFGGFLLLPVLINGSLLFLALILYLLLFPLLMHARLDYESLIAISVMSLFFFVPLAIAFRAVDRSRVGGQGRV